MNLDDLVIAPESAAYDYGEPSSSVRRRIKNALTKNEHAKMNIDEFIKFLYSMDCNSLNALNIAPSSFTVIGVKSDRIIRVQRNGNIVSSVEGETARYDNNQKYIFGAIDEKKGMRVKNPKGLSISMHSLAIFLYNKECLFGEDKKPYLANTIFERSRFVGNFSVQNGLFLLKQKALVPELKKGHYLVTYNDNKLGNYFRTEGRILGIE